MTERVTALVSASSRARIEASVSFIESFAPATEVLVIGPSRSSVDDLVRRVAMRAAQKSPGEPGARLATFGIHRKTLSGFMVELAAPRLADKKRSVAARLALEAVAKSVVVKALHDDRLAYFGRARGPRAAAEAPSFARALLTTLLDLRRQRITVNQLESGSPGERDLAVLLGLYEAELEARELADARDVGEEAVIGAGDAPLARAPMVFVDVALRSVGEIEALEVLLGQAKSALLVVPRGDDATIAALRSLGVEPRTDAESTATTSLARAQNRIFLDDPGEVAIPDATVVLASAPSEAHEMVEIARSVVALAADGIPFDEMAIALPSRAIYAQNLETALARAAIPAYFSFGTRRPHAAGRALCALLAFRVERFSARRFAEYLSLGQVPDKIQDSEAHAYLAPLDESLGRFGSGAQASDEPPDEIDEEGIEETSDFGERENRKTGGQEENDGDSGERRFGRVRAPRRWERLLGEAQTLEVLQGETGRAYYERRLGALQTTLQRTRDALERDDPSSPRIASVERDIRDTGELLAFALPILDACDRLPALATWEEWIALSEDLARTALKKPEPVLAVLAELRALSGSPPVAVREVLDVLEDRLLELDRPPPKKRFGRVFVTTPRDLRGRSFRVVFVPGLTERVFPARVREDPLLIDDARRVLSPLLATNDLRSADERLALLSAIGAATDRAFLSYPRVEAALGRPRVPSFYALDVARAISGKLPDVDEMQRAAAREADARLDWPAPRDPKRAIDELEHDLSVLRELLDAPPSAKPEGKGRYLLEENAHLARALRTRWSRFDRSAITANDGLVRLGAENLEILRGHSLQRRAFSASALQLYARCPYRFYLSAVLGLAERETPGRVETLSPAMRGSLFHNVAAELTIDLLKDGLLPVPPGGIASAKERLKRIFEREKAELNDALRPLVPRVFEDDARQVLSDLEALVDSDLSDASDFVPIHADLGFGVPKHEHFDAGGTPEPAKLRGGQLLRGAIDVVERHRTTGKLRVTDYKTGVPKDRGVLSIGGGEELQPVLYSLVVHALRGIAFATDAEVSDARLSYPTKRGGFEERGVRIDADAERRATEALEAIDAAVVDGFLMARPRRDACKGCPFRPVCGPHEEQRTSRKTASTPAEKKHLDALVHIRRQP